VSNAHPFLFLSLL